MSDEPEIPLLGGDVSEGVVRKGDTVRRPIGEGAAAVHAFLDHLEAVGFEHSPRFLGIDERGRAILTYLEGEMGGRPLHHWAVTEEALTEVARIQRSLHDASVGFVLPDGVGWPSRAAAPGVPPLPTGDVVGHNDITFENTIFRDGIPVGLIDFDFAHHTSRLRDITTTLLHWAPMVDPLDRDQALRDVDAVRRTRLFVDAYGLSPEQRQALVAAIDQRNEGAWVNMKHLAETRGGGWRRMWDEGVGDLIQRRVAWFETQRDAMRAALE